MTLGAVEKRRGSPFALWLRTGRWLPAQLADPALEVKFNPNHDPKDGRFTFKNGGGGSTDANPSTQPRGQRGREDPRIVASDRQLKAREWASSVRNPANQEIYTIKPGDTLTTIAAKRANLSASDLIWLNSLQSDQIKVGQTIKIPSQGSLDAGRRAAKDGLAYIDYVDKYGGKLPPVGQRPTFEQQVFGAGAHVERRNGYDFAIDYERRPRLIEGTISRNPDQRRDLRAQAVAGVPDRLPTDEGGHYIARRFNGPSDAFNHFAQDRNFNRSRYAKLENVWARADKQGQRVYVTIIPNYVGASKRPSSLKVSYSIGGIRYSGSFNNRSGRR